MRRRVRKGIWRTLCDSWRTFCHFGLRPLQREELRRRPARLTPQVSAGAWTCMHILPMTPIKLDTQVPADPRRFTGGSRDTHTLIPGTYMYIVLSNM